MRLNKKNQSSGLFTDFQCNSIKAIVNNSHVLFAVKCLWSNTIKQQCQKNILVATSSDIPIIIIR